MTHGDDVDAVAALGDAVRRRLYDYVCSTGTAVGRDQAATAVGIKRTLAAYHLDRLAASGLLDVRYERPPGRKGPGAGRPGKLYMRSQRDVQVSLPARSYGLAAQVLADALETAGVAVVQDTLLPAAARIGREIAMEACRGDGDRPEGDALPALLAAHGYDPADDADGTLRLKNCPFHALALDHTELVCNMNLALMKGMCAVAAPDVRPELDPTAGRCCVAFPPPDPG